MSILQGILLGLLQGVAEFLPISSSGHLAVLQNIMGLEDVPVLYDVFLHLATLCAVVLYFRKKIWELLCALGRFIARKPYKNESFTETQCREYDLNSRRYILAVILATVVTGVAGIIVKKLGFDQLPVKAVCGGFIFTAVLLVSSSLVEKHREKKVAAVQAESNAAAESESAEKLPYTAEQKSPSWWQSLVIGFAQGVGTLAGVSRSGSTIAGSLFCGVNRQQAGEFSFIVSIPAILGAFILELKDLGDVGATIGAAPVIAGCIAAFISGYAALTWLMKLIKKGRLEWFACYLIPAGILGMIFLH